MGCRGAVALLVIAPWPEKIQIFVSIVGGVAPTAVLRSADVSPSQKMHTIPQELRSAFLYKG